MKKNILLICLGFLFVLGEAQDTIAKTPDMVVRELGCVFRSLNHKIAINTNYSLTSTAFNSTFIQSIYQGKFIDDNLKNSVHSRLGAYNLLGAEINSTLLYHQEFKPGKYFYAGVGYNIDLGAQFTGDLFNLVFYGNKDFAGKTADLSGTQVKYMESQSLQFGFSKEWKDSMEIKHRMDIGMSLINGQNLYNINVSKGNVFTQQTGEYIDITMKGDMYQTNTNSFSNGLGVGLNFKYEIKKDTTYRILFEAKNVGFMRWNNNTTHSSMDTTLRFEGIVIDNIFAIQDSTFKNINAQSIAGDGLKTKNASHWMLLPLTLRANYRHYLGAKNYLEGDITYKNWGTYIPKLIVSYGRQFNRSISAEINGGYGGYGTYHVGANISAVCCKFLWIKIGASDVLGFVAPKQFCNQGAYLMASYLF